MKSIPCAVWNCHKPATHKDPRTYSVGFYYLCDEHYAQAVAGMNAENNEKRQGKLEQ